MDGIKPNRHNRWRGEYRHNRWRIINKRLKRARQLRGMKYTPRDENEAINNIGTIGFKMKHAGYTAKHDIYFSCPNGRHCGMCHHNELTHHDKILEIKAKEEIDGS